MGIYQVKRQEGVQVRLRDLATDHLFQAICQSGYCGTAGGLTMSSRSRRIDRVTVGQVRRQDSMSSSGACGHWCASSATITHEWTVRSPASGALASIKWGSPAIWSRSISSRGGVNGRCWVNGRLAVPAHQSRRNNSVCSRPLGHDLPIFPDVYRCPVRTRDFPGSSSGKTQASFNPGREAFGFLPSDCFAHGHRSSNLGASPELSYTAHSSASGR